MADAVAELTARLAGIRPGQAWTDADPGHVIAALAIIGAAALRELLPDAAENLLVTLGMAAAEAGLEPGAPAE